MSDQFFESINPATQEVVGRTSRFDTSEIEQALERADRQARNWAQSSFTERSALLEAVADQLESRRDELDAQVRDALERGAELLTGGAPHQGRGYFYQPTVISGVTPGMRTYSEELSGPVASILRAKDEAHALQIANDSVFGLGGSVWTRDRERGFAVARRLECGCVFVNELVKSDPRLPFGGIKTSGYGRELSHHGIREFVNAKTLWID